MAGEVEIARRIQHIQGLLAAGQWQAADALPDKMPRDEGIQTALPAKAIRWR